MAHLLHAAGFEQSLHTAAADAHVERGSPSSNFGSSQTMLVKRSAATTSAGTDRFAYLRFTVDGPLSTINGAALELTFSQFPGDGTTPFTFEVYGLPDGHPDEAFNENTLAFSNAANASTSAPGSFLTSGVSFLGTFTPAAASGTAGAEFTATALRDFIAAGGNNHVTLAIVRQTPNGSPSSIQSSEVSVISQRPTLVVRRPASVIPPAAATASSTLAGSAAANAVDESASTRWTAAADTSSTKSWLTLDLGSPQTVNRLNFIAHEHGRAYKLESSNDNSTWSLVATDFRSGVGSGTNTLGRDTDVFFQPRAARYFRLTSLTSLSGKSVSMWEVQLFNDASASAVLSRAASLSASVSALPASTPEEKIKRVVLEVSIERASASLNAGETAHADLLLDDVQNNLAADSAVMAAQVSGLSNIRVLRPLLQTGVANNPYLKRLIDGVTLFLASPDSAWEKNTAQTNVLEDFNLARTTGAQIDALFWIFAHPDSPMKNDPEILRRLLRRTHAYLDAIQVHGPSLHAGQLTSFYDDFAVTPASGVFREFLMLYPGLVAANAEADWNAAMQTAAANLWSAYQNRVASWVNTDVAIACSLYNFGERTSNAAMIAKSEYFINEVLASGRMFEDGAVGYIGTQNEAGGYQALVSEYVTRYFETTGHANAGIIMAKMQWYGPINGRIADWWTSPSWKDAWNDNRSSFHAGESVAGSNPYVRAELDASINAAATTTNWYGRPRVDIAWYQGGVTPKSRPDYLVFDRNIRGPRAWHGRWNYAATLRDISPTEPGHYTLMGAQVADPDPDFRCNASLMGVFPRLRVSATPRNADNSLNEAGHAWLTSNLAGDSTVARDFSAFGASYQVHQFGSSTKGADHDWTGRQVWLNLPDRVIGLLDISPNADLPAQEVQGVIRLGFGGTAYSATKTLASTGPDSWSYGDLRIKLHSHNYAEVSPEVYFFRVANAPVTEITLRDMAGGAANTTPNIHTAGTRRKFIAEIRPAWTSGEVTVNEVAETGGLVGLDVDHPGTGRHYRVIYNPGTTAVNHTPDLGWSGPVRIHQSGERHRPDWLPDPSGQLVASYLTSGQSLVIQPKAHVVLERCGPVIKADNPDALDTSTSWTNGPVTDGGIAEWNAAVTSANASPIGNGVNLAGVRITDPGGDVAIQQGTAGTLAIGPAGIDASTSPRALTLSAPVRLDTPQTWTTGNSGAAGSLQIIANGAISGSGGIDLTAASDRGLALNAANTFSGGVTLRSGGIQYSGAPAIAASGAAVTSGPFGTGPLAVHGGFLTAGARPFFNPAVAIHGDFTWSTTARVDTSGGFDLTGGARAIRLTRSVTPANVVISGGNNSIRFTTITGGSTSNTFSNGTLALAASSQISAPNFAVATFGTSGGNRFIDNAGLVAGPRVYISPSFTSSPFGTAANEKPAVTLDAGSFLSLSDGGSGRGHAIFSLAGQGTVLNNTSGTAARTDTLTIDGGAKTATFDFAGVIRDTDTATFPTADPNLKTALVKAGGTTQVLSGPCSFTGPTTVSGGVLRVTGSLSGTSGLAVATGARFETTGSVSVAGDITNDGTLVLSGDAALSFSGTFTNNGVLDLSAWNGSLPPGVINHGTIIPAPGPEIFGKWQMIHWPGNTDIQTIGPEADPDHDGVNNLLEWALHLDPVTPDVFLPALSKTGPVLEYRYLRRKTAPGGAAFHVEWADSPDGAWAEESVTSAPPLSVSETSESVTATMPAGLSGRRFVRLRVVQP